MVGDAAGAGLTVRGCRSNSRAALLLGGRLKGAGNRCWQVLLAYGQVGLNVSICPNVMACLVPITICFPNDDSLRLIMVAALAY